MDKELDGELHRLLALQKRNPTIRAEEVQLLRITIPIRIWGHN
jgi:hypothetical protein